MEIKLTDDQKIKVTKPNEIFMIMQQILLRENKYSRNREHFWVVGLDIDNTILYIELVSIGNMETTLVDPKEVFRVGILKFARYLILVHNHPFGHLEAGDNDIKITNHLLHAARLVRLEVIDHLIINTKKFSSFGNDGILNVLEQSEEFLTNDMKEEKYRKETEIEIAGNLLKNGVEIDVIVKSTGLSKTEINKLSKTKTKSKTRKKTV